MLDELVEEYYKKRRLLEVLPLPPSLPDSRWEEDNIEAEKKVEKYSKLVKDVMDLQVKIGELFYGEES